ncbi:hypothetical protein GCM10010424_66680 [Streptomyces lienomycini]
MLTTPSAGVDAGAALPVPAAARAGAAVQPVNGTWGEVREGAGVGAGVSVGGPPGPWSTRPADRGAGAAVASGLRIVRRMRFGMRGTVHRSSPAHKGAAGGS